ncbi:putative membrane protein [Lachnospiraceae bacterium PM6-15]|uniref:SdpI family protein n=1 Tax=Ohessyouella blattaphilus TaxID=2949333 RepID=UPI003E23EE4C
MKLRKLLIWIVPILTFIVSAIGYIMLPDKIPTHFNFNGCIDSWGSKNFLLIIGVVPLVLSFIVYLAKRNKLNSSKDANVELVFHFSTIVVSFVLLVVQLVWIYLSLVETNTMNKILNITHSQLVNIFTSIILIFLGLLMPFCTKNRIIGFRTSWSMKNSCTWEYSQKNCGIIFVITGVVILILSFIVTDSLLLATMLITIFCMSILCIIITKMAYNKYGKNE